jgi:hypothetical protein
MTKKSLLSIILYISDLQDNHENLLKKVLKIFGGSEKMLYFCPLERWQSGRLRRS